MSTIPEKDAQPPGSKPAVKETIKSEDSNSDDLGEIISDGSASAFSATERALTSEMDELHRALKKRDPDNPSGQTNY